MQNTIVKMTRAIVVALGFVWLGTLPALAEEYPCIGLMDRITDEEADEIVRKNKESTDAIRKAWEAAEGDVIKFVDEYDKIGFIEEELEAEAERAGRLAKQSVWDATEGILEFTNSLVAGRISLEDTDNRKDSFAGYWRNITPEQVKTCLSDGENINVNVQSKQGRTPLHNVTRFNKDSEVIMTLLGAGADATLKDNNGHTPFDWVEHNKALKDTEAYQALKDAQ